MEEWFDQAHQPLNKEVIMDNSTKIKIPKLKFPDYQYIDTAFGGVYKRNNVQSIFKLEIPNKTDCYITYFRFPQEYLNHSKKNNSVSGYKGACYSDYFCLDIDNKDLPQAHQKTKSCLLFLETELGVHLKHVQVFFSGAKGFHIYLPAELFGFKPSPLLPKIHKLIASELFSIFDIDPAIYEINRLFRLPNTRHSKTGLFKRQISIEDILNKPTEEIRSTAKNPGPPFEPLLDCNLNPYLNEICLKYFNNEKTFSNQNENDYRKENFQNATIREGRRNETLFREGSALRGRGWEQEEILTALLEINKNRCSPPLPEREIEIISKSVSKYPPNEKNTIQTQFLDADKTAYPNFNKPENINYISQQEIHETDLGNARRLVQKFGDKIRYCHSLKIWLIWDNIRWGRDRRGRIIVFATETSLEIYKEAAVEKNEKRRQEKAKWAIRSESKEKLLAMVELAKSEPDITILPEELDANPWLFNVENGTINLQTGELLPHTPEHFITKLAPVTYDPKADCPKFKEFLQDIFQMSNDPDAMIGYLQRYLGYCLTAKNTEDIFPIFWGTGANGKSTLIETISALMGDYARAAAPDILLIKRGDSHPTGLADLAGSRLVTTVETEENARLAESLIKQLTGGDRIKARQLYKDYFEFTPTFKIIMATNHKPQIGGTDYAIWRRIHLVPFNYTIPEEKRDPNIRDHKFKDEWPGILNWLIDGCIAWQEKGLSPPEEVKQATEQYKSESDVIGEWLEQFTIYGREYETSAKDLYQSYTRFAEESGDRPVTQKTFGRKLQEKGFVKIRRRNGIFWRGIGINDECERCE